MQNTLYTNDNLYVLHGLNSSSVDLIYLDPPFNSKRMYSAPIGSKAAGASFKDMWTWEDVNEGYLDALIVKYPFLVRYIQSIEGMHGKAMMAYVTYMTQRIIEMHRVLKDTGSLYLHCDPTASHYLKLVLDEVFGKNNFRNEIIWCYRKWTNAANRFQKNHDIILFYAKTEYPNFNKLSDNNKKAHQERGYTTNVIDGVTQLLVYDRYKAKDKIKGGKYDKIVYRDEHKDGTALPDWWDISIINSQSKERTGYPTQKPLALLHRIIKASSNEGDVVLDPFCGCATTCVAAQQLNRKWIGIDIEKKAAEVLIERLSDDAGMFKNFVHTKTIPQRTDVTKTEPSKSIKEKLFHEQACKCNACGTAFEIQHLEIDHIIPKAKGGGNYYENYQLLCGSCNRIKGDRPMEYLRIKIKSREALLRTAITFGA